MALDFPPDIVVRSPVLTIRSHLFLLALCAILPVLAFAFFVSVLLVEQSRDAIRNGAMDRARAVLTAVDAELRGSITTLEALATSRALEAGDLKRFHNEAVRVAASQRIWSSVNLASTSDYQQVMNSAVPFGEPLNVLADQPSADEVRRTRLPAVGSVTTGKMLGIPLVAVRAPVLRNREVAYILTALVQPESFNRLIRQQDQPQGWVISIIDSNGRFIARVPVRAPGSLASDSLREAMRNAAQGWFRGPTVEGTDTYTAHFRSDFSNWTVALAIPAAFVEDGARRTAWILGSGAVASLLLAMFAAILIGRRISGPVIALASAAREIGTGEMARHPGFDRVREISEVASALRHSGEAIRERQKLIEREKGALLEADRAKDQFIAMLSHELRNPLSALTAAAHLLKLAGPAGSASEHARGVIERQTRHMTRLIEDLLDINRVAMGKATLVREPLDLAELVSDVVRTWRASGRLAEHIVTVDVSHATVDADRSRIEQVFSNLLENALKFTPHGRKVAVSVSQKGAEAVLSVRDEGEGIESALVDRIFGLFVQGPQPLDRQSGGLGVGLALVKGLVELHGGQVAASSEGSGRGATFTVRLPVTGAQSVQPIAQSTVASATAPSRRILIVEDNNDARHMLRVMLELTGNEVREAADAHTGLRMAAEQTPEVMIVDIGLPDLSGYELAARIRTTPWGAGVVLIALTGYGQAEDKRRALEAGFNAHVTKPVLPEQLATLIDAAGRTLEARAG